MADFTLHHSAQLRRQLEAALKARGEDYRPRTRHLKPDGSPRFTNRLIREASPYLLQHAHNPVDWYPWGEQAFEAASRLQRPIFLSIGYATCHWCHVMEHESFEALEIAAQLNDHFIPVKVDREQLPAVDEAYMLAANLISGHSGWPLSVFLTPDGKPFFAASYFPSAQFQQLLEQTFQIWQQQANAVQQEGERILAALQRLMSGEGRHQEVDSKALANQAVSYWLDQLDLQHGGFGIAPKFPQEAVLALLLDCAQRDGNQSALNAVKLTLSQMQQGGIYDQVGGGFHRYATDAGWQVPHFEKMLYNQAQLVPLYLQGWRLTGNPLFRRTAEQTLQYVLREMVSPQGGFHAASDADSEGGEGRFFVWQQQQLAQCLTPEDAELARSLFDTSSDGNFEGANVLHLTASLPEFAKLHRLETGYLIRHLDQIRDSLYQARLQRPPPLHDRKLIAGWNGLMISALTQAGGQLHNPRYLSAGWQAAEQLWQHHWQPDSGQLLRDSLDGKPGAQGTLEDYAALARAMLDLYDASADPLWLDRATMLADQMIKRFQDRQHGSFFLDQAEGPLPLRVRIDNDGAQTSASALAIELLLALAERSGDQRYRQLAEQALQQHSAEMNRNPAHYGSLLCAQRRLTEGPLNPIRYGAGGALKINLSGDPKHLVVDLQLRKGWHLNAHRPEDPALAGTCLSAEGLSTVEYPPPIRQQLPFSDQPLQLYQGHIQIRGRFDQAAVPVSQPLTLSYQACSERHCLAPEKLTLWLPSSP
ncbi:DUF255 domain-containing protein [Marinobacterium arenosum]|uniref:DUF255 domain-containing protein n=1 Tax=Marinobacterium arenosum TaxID=2862496 RepID=UPI001C96B0A4|nr:DUF255 domain-containing protein [Marinobacterium arenosum]MBY4675446.1 DUF255 domain-containing protein [Marinobacterium arenosum]